MVVVLPQPLEPKKPKISPRLISKLTLLTAVKSPKRKVRSVALITISCLSGANGVICSGSTLTAPDKHEIVIKATDLTLRFGDFTAVNNVSFEIKRGEIFGFLGSNGCGKTTTMKVLTGLLPATEGEAWLLGKPVDANDLATRKRVGFMSQSFSLYGELTVLQNLELHAHLFDIPKAVGAERAQALIKRFELGSYTNEQADRKSVV